MTAAATDGSSDETTREGVAALIRPGDEEPAMRSEDAPTAMYSDEQDLPDPDAREAAATALSPTA